MRERVKDGESLLSKVPVPVFRDVRAPGRGVDGGVRDREEEAGLGFVAP